MRFSIITTVLTMAAGAMAAATATLCTDANRGGFCIDVVQAADNACSPLGGDIRGHLTSIFPKDTGAQWTLFTDVNCNGGQQLGNIVKPGINNLADFGFNDVANAFKVSFR